MPVRGNDGERSGRSMAQWIGIGVALVVGLWTAIREPALPLFEHSTRAAGLTGPVLQILSMLYWVAEVTVAMTIAYVVFTVVLKPLARLF